MYTIAILESGRKFSGFLSRSLPERLRREIDLCPAECLPPGHTSDLLVVAPDLRWEGSTPAVCRALLIPGRLSALAGELRAGWAVSYGISARDSLTLSSLGEKNICLALQRELVTLTGECLDCQELLLPRGGHTAPYHVLACAGIQLLLGVPPEDVAVGG